MSRHFALCLAILFGPHLPLQAQQPAVEIESLITEYENNVRANTQKLIAAATEEERNQFRASVPSAQPYAEKVLKIVQANESDAGITRGLSWLITQTGGFPEGQTAVKMLGNQHVKSQGIAEAVKALENHPLENVEPILLAIREKNPNAEERAAASYALGSQYFRRFDSNPNATDAEKPKAKAMEYFQDVVTQYEKVTIQGFPIAEQASRMLFEMANLSIGAEAPDIEGKELDGTAFKLSEQRGKHVVLMFWGGWCHACHGVLPLVNQLASDLKDKPVVVLGINTDIPEEATKAFAEYKVSFRNWSDGTTGGPITTLYNIRNFPTLYLIDPKGVILLKNPSLDAIREKLKTIKD